MRQEAWYVSIPMRNSGSLKIGFIYINPWIERESSEECEKNGNEDVDNQYEIIQQKILMQEKRDNNLGKLSRIRKGKNK